jgi:hypothetical protein
MLAFLCVRFVALLLLLASGSVLGADRNLTPRHDPPDQPFRRAPMAQSARSIAVPLSAALNLAFETERNRVHTIWQGEPLNLWGPPYSSSKSPFICDFKGRTLFSFPQLNPWWTKGKREILSNFRGIQTGDEGVVLSYELLTANTNVFVTESARGSVVENAWSVERVFRFPNGAPEALHYLAFADAKAEVREEQDTVRIRNTNGTFYLRASGPQMMSWEVLRERVNYTNETVTEIGTEKGNPRNTVRDEETRLFLNIPQISEPFEFRIQMSSVIDAPPVASPRVSARSNRVFRGGIEQWRASGDEFYSIQHFPLPPEAELIITGMDWLNEKDLAICTWLGEVYIIRNATGRISEVLYERFARGLNEPLGLAVHDQKIYVVQKGELTRVTDSDKDGEADRFECISDDWGYSGNYHSYSFGPLITPAGNFLIFTTGQRGRYDLPYQGWALEVLDSGELKPIAHGLRVPHGWGLYGRDRDILFTDNQGNWIGTCKLNHLKRGNFYGFPSSFPAPREESKAEDVAEPVLWLPRSLSPSASGIETIADKHFGPFEGQLLIGDFQNAIVMRAYLEKVDGEWQGAVFPFLKGFLSGVNRLKMDAEGRLYVGGGKRTWSTAAPKEYSLDRVIFTGKVPFDVQEVRATKTGFKISFTKELDSAAALDPANYLVKQFTYKYQSEYGSPEFDHEGKTGATETAVSTVQLLPDGKSVELKIPALRTGFVTSFQLALTSVNDEDLRTDTFFYTLKRQPLN